MLLATGYNLLFLLNSAIFDNYFHLISKQSAKIKWPSTFYRIQLSQVFLELWDSMYNTIVENKNLPSWKSTIFRVSQTFTRNIYIVSKSFKGCVRYIFAFVCFLCVKESTCETTKNVSYFTVKAIFVLEIIKFWIFQMFKRHGIIKCP